MPSSPNDRPPAPDGVATHAALRACGVPKSTIAYRCRPTGPWRRLLPGVVLLDTAAPTRRQRLRATIARAGAPAVITGADALLAHGLGLPVPALARVLLPHHRRLVIGELAVAERTTRLPEPMVIDGLPFAPPVRATADLARNTAEEDELHRLLARVMRAGLCDPDRLREELDAGNQRGSAAVRTALEALTATEDATGRGPARAILRRWSIAPPEWDVVVHDAMGRTVGHVDAWWDALGVGWRLDTGPSGALAAAAAGVTIIRTPVAEVRAATRDSRRAAAVAGELSSALAAAARRRRPSVRVSRPL
ncbi:hypothetical protein [Haloechinothrix sp. LS1_15]|uniref:hypothetical protein n=1 Tax=Haloechinothrix sp. LS1_15 TaxID=2652248 RepID=UPI00294504A0|nr:hypothetical protein [Haloechinothrix sp. LS1_15]MDV6014582.1 hypothetical protein [Haloechinothrix sp. LS1_15]